MLSLPDQLTHIVTVLRAVIRMVTPPVPARDPREMMFHRLWNRVGRAARLFARLHALWLANKLPAPRPARAAPPAAPADAPAPPASLGIPATPRANGWLLRLGQHHAAFAHTLLGLYLQREDLRAFLAAVPRAGRYLRPLCRLLAVPQPAFLALPPRPRRPRPPRNAADRPRTPRPSRAAWPIQPPAPHHIDPPVRPFVLGPGNHVRKNYDDRF